MINNFSTVYAGDVDLGDMGQMEGRGSRGRPRSWWPTSSRWKRRIPASSTCT